MSKQNAKAPKGKAKAYGLVRDKHGKPKITNTRNIPAAVWDMLTDDEKEEILNGNDA